jgi:uncharacterized protein
VDSRSTAVLLENVDNFSLSFDGIQLVQDRQRPRTNGDGSFEVVRETLRALDEKGASYGIRMTAPPELLKHLPESVEFLCQQTKAHAIQVEPNYTSQRGLYGEMERDYAQEFIRVFMAAFEIASQYRRPLFYSGARPWVVTTEFCQAASRALIVTPRGELVTCFEIFDTELPHARKFMVGQATDQTVEFDAPALDTFIADQQSRRQRCQDCFCYWHCCGDCATRSLSSQAPECVRCDVNRGITRELLAWYLSKGDGVWRGVGDEMKAA